MNNVIFIGGRLCYWWLSAGYKCLFSGDNCLVSEHDFEIIGICRECIKDNKIRYHIYCPISLSTLSRLQWLNQSRSTKKSISKPFKIQISLPSLIFGDMPSYPCACDAAHYLSLRAKEAGFCSGSCATCHWWASSKHLVRVALLQNQVWFFPALILDT